MPSLSTKALPVISALVILFTLSAAGWLVRSEAAPGTEPTAGSVHVPVIMYHHILKDPSRWGDYIISPDEFEEDLRYLSAAGYTSISMTQLINYVKYGGPLPEKPVILSFDDGHRSFLTYALPLLKKYGQQAVVAVVGSYSETYSTGDDHNPAYAYLDWEEIAVLSASGFAEIQNHTWALHDNSGRRNGAKKLRGETLEQYARVLSDDIGRLQDKLEEITGTRPNTFVYPFGAVSPESVGILRDMGFEAALDCEGRLNLFTPGDEDALMDIHRVNRRHGLSAQAIIEKLTKQ